MGYISYCNGIYTDYRNGIYTDFLGVFRIDYWNGGLIKGWGNNDDTELGG